jgi:hypothetical protein
VRPLFWGSLGEERARLLGQLIGTLAGAVVLVAIVTTVLRWRGHPVSLRRTTVFAVGLAATGSGLTDAPEASFHDELALGVWGNASVAVRPHVT